MERHFSCVLCNKSEETKTTGPLLTKAEVTAHQNCLLFSSGICCQNSPEYDDLFGFSVMDVLKEVNRGKKLNCHYCHQKGATAGCEVKRCSRSYHYPCAVEDGAVTREDGDRGTYEIRCLQHSQKKDKGNIQSQTSSPSSNKAGSTKKKHDGPSAGGSDSQLSSSAKRPPVKRQLIPSDKKEESRRKKIRVISDDSSSTDCDELRADIDIHVTIEDSMEESPNFSPESQLNPSQFQRKITDRAAASPSGDLEVDQTGDKDIIDETLLHSDTDSDIVQLPANTCLDSGSPVLKITQQSPQKKFTPMMSELKTAGKDVAGGTPGRCRRGGSRRGPSSAPNPQPEPKPVILSPSISPPSPSLGPIDVSPPASPFPTSLQPSIQSNIKSRSFWKSCNAAGCTQTIFTDFMDNMKVIAKRIQSEEASQEEYDMGLSVMVASGKLEVFVRKQHKELQRKQKELQKAMTAVMEVASALKNITS